MSDPTRMSKATGGYRPTGPGSMPTFVENMRSSVQRPDVALVIAYEGGRMAAFGAVLESAKTMTREMLIQWVEAEIARG